MRAIEVGWRKKKVCSLDPIGAFGDKHFFSILSSFLAQKRKIEEARFPPSSFPPKMECEHAASTSVPAVGFALRACPFLKAVAAKEGDDFAARFSIAPLLPAAAAAVSAPAASARAAPPLEEEAAFAGFASSYSFFHGEGGVVPLVGAKRAMATMTNSAAASQLCPFFHAASPAAAPARAEAALSASESKETACVKVPEMSGGAKRDQAGQGSARERGSSPASPLSLLPSSSALPSPLLPAASAPFASISLRLFGGGMVSCVS